MQTNDERVRAAAAISIGRATEVIEDLSIVVPTRELPIDCLRKESDELAQGALSSALLHARGRYD